MGLTISEVLGQLKYSGISLEKNPNIPDGYPNNYNEEQFIQSIITFLSEVYPMQELLAKLEKKLNGDVPRNFSEISDELKEIAPEEYKALVTPKKGKRFLVEGNIMFIFQYDELIENEIDSDVLCRLENSTESFLFRTHKNLLLLIPIFIPSTEKIYEMISGKDFQHISRSFYKKHPIITLFGVILLLYSLIQSILFILKDV